MPKISPIPSGFHTVTPHLVCDGAADAIEFYKSAFGAAEVCRHAGPDGRIFHAQVRIGDSPVMLFDEMPDCGALGPRALKGSSVTIHLSVENADEVFGQAVIAGAKIKMPMQEMFWGARYGVVEDPFGHNWSIATQVRDVSSAELQQAAEKMFAQPA